MRTVWELEVSLTFIVNGSMPMLWVQLQSMVEASQRPINKVALVQVGYSREYIEKLVEAEQKRQADAKGIQYEYNTAVRYLFNIQAHRLLAPLFQSDLPAWISYEASVGSLDAQCHHKTARKAPLSFPGRCVDSFSAR